MTPFNFKVRKGDTYNGAVIRVRVNGQAVPLDGASLLMQVRKNPLDPPALVLSTGHGLTIIDAADSVIQIDSQQFNLDAGIYQYGIRFTLRNGVSKTWVTGTITAMSECQNG